MISRAKLHAMQIEVLTKKGRTDPMPETEVNGILFKMNTDLRALKKGEADGAPSVSVSVQVVAFATDIPSHIYAFHRYTGNSTTLYCTLAR